MRRRDVLLSMPMALPFLPSALADVYRAPTPERTIWNVRELGAVGDGKTLNTAVLQKALDAASNAGGGTVVVPAGIFVTGSLILGSNTTLQLDAGAILLASPSLPDYAKGGQLLSATAAQNVAITGNGTIDGNALHFAERREREPFAAGSEWLDVVIFDWKPLTQFGGMVIFSGCQNVSLSGVTLRHSPRWTLTFDQCDTVSVDGLKIRNPNYIPETDGIDIVCSRNVIIRGCDIATADDAICLKSEGEGEIPPTSNVLVTDCLLTGCCNGFKIGTGSKGRFESIQFTNSVIYNTEAPLRERMIGAICLEVVDGGSLDGVRISGIQIQKARTPIFVRLARRSGGIGELKNVAVVDVQAFGAISASSITGLPGNDVEGITLRNLRLESEENGKEAWTKLPVDERADHYPEALMFEHLPASALYVRHAKDIRLEDLDAISLKPDGRPVMLFEDVAEIELSSVRFTPPSSDQPVFALHNCREAWLHDLRAASGTRLFLEVTGEQTTGIRFANNDLSAAHEPLRAPKALQDKILQAPQHP